MAAASEEKQRNATRGRGSTEPLTTSVMRHCLEKVWNQTRLFKKPPFIHSGEQGQRCLFCCYSFYFSAFLKFFLFKKKPNFKFCGIATVIKTVWHWWRDRATEQKRKTPEIEPHEYAQMISDKDAKAIPC